MKIFDTKPKSGCPVRLKMFFTAMLRMARAWEKLAVHNGHVDWSDGIPTIVLDNAGGSGAMPFSGFAWVGNKPMITVNLADAGATNFLSIRLDGSGYDWVGSMPTSQPADAVVFRLDQTAGDIHLPGNIAPGGE